MAKDEIEMTAIDNNGNRFVVKLSIFLLDNKTKLVLNLNDVLIEQINEFPFFALKEIRRYLQNEYGLTLECNGSCYNVYPSGMSSVGYKAYIMIMGIPATKLVNIFEPPHDISKLGTIEEQEYYRCQWFQSLGLV